MRKYQPLLLQKLDIRIPGIHVRQLAVHRHLPETTDIRPHAHKFSQCLLYLSGQGRQQIHKAVYAARTGTAVFLPPHREHAFRREANRRPICLIIDFDWRGAQSRPARVQPLPFSVLREIRHELAGISHLQRLNDSAPRLQMSAQILKLLNAVLGGLMLTKQLQPAPVSPVSRKLDVLLESPESANFSLAKLAGLAGYQHDYLNRMLKKHAGLTLGQFRSRKLVARAQQLLRQVDSISSVSSALGFAEPNYFARWFRKQTGMTPSEWQRHLPDH